MKESFREHLGKIVREAWVACKREEASAGFPVKPEHLLAWDELPEREREIDRRIGEDVAKEVLGVTFGYKVVDV